MSGRNCIRPGMPFLDTEGKRIQAHGGSIFFDEAEGIFYFYGENKEFTTRGSPVWTWGVRAYASRDFYNWEDRGLIIPPVTDDDASPLNPYRAALDRPHIIYNGRTRKYVCWCKIMGRGDDPGQRELILSADRFLGPYKIENPGLEPFGLYGGDFDLAVDEAGQAFYFFEESHSRILSADLTEDFLDVRGTYSAHFAGRKVPHSREAPAHFQRRGKHYLITSGVTGYLPNPSEVAVADSRHGPYRVLGDPCPGDASRTTFHSQISSVFRFPGKEDLYVALADRWCPEIMTLPYGFYETLAVRLRSGEVPAEKTQEFVRELARAYAVSDFDLANMNTSARNTSRADYVWLPLRFVDPCEDHPNGMVVIEWKDFWRIEDYA